MLTKMITDFLHIGVSSGFPLWFLFACCSIVAILAFLVACTFASNKACNKMVPRITFADRWEYWKRHQEVVDGTSGKSADQVLCEFLKSKKNNVEEGK